MSTYNSWTVVVMPASPAPKSLEFSANSIVGVSNNPFSGQQQIQDWNASWMELQVSLPPMSRTQASAWAQFLLACKGQASVFQLPSTGSPSFASFVPAGAAPGGYWRLKNNANKFSVSDGVVYGFQFEIREAI